MDERTPQQRRKALRNAVIVAVVAVAFYAGFIFVEYLRSRGGG
ncbi:MAG TPA: hypothetical protein VJ947_07005 [Pseudohaliea sp.]|nr:hypothetical protein [Pseudohaliea sp.]